MYRQVLNESIHKCICTFLLLFYSLLYLTLWQVITLCGSYDIFIYYNPQWCGKSNTNFIHNTQPVLLIHRMVSQSHSPLAGWQTQSAWYPKWRTGAWAGVGGPSLGCGCPVQEWQRHKRVSWSGSAWWRKADDAGRCLGWLFCIVLVQGSWKDPQRATRLSSVLRSCSWH